MRKLIRPKVTVIMNVHNGEEFISEAIASVINQTNILVQEKIQNYFMTTF